VARAMPGAKPKVRASLSSHRSGGDKVVDDAEGHGEPLQPKCRVSLAEV